MQQKYCFVSNWSSSVAAVLVCFLPMRSSSLVFLFVALYYSSCSLRQSHVPLCCVSLLSCSQHQSHVPVCCASLLSCSLHQSRVPLCCASLLSCSLHQSCVPLQYCHAHCVSLVFLFVALHYYHAPWSSLVFLFVVLHYCHAHCSSLVFLFIALHYCHALCSCLVFLFIIVMLTAAVSCSSSLHFIIVMLTLSSLVFLFVALHYCHAHRSSHVPLCCTSLSSCSEQKDKFRSTKWFMKERDVIFLHLQSDCTFSSIFCFAVTVAFIDVIILCGEGRWIGGVGWGWGELPLHCSSVWTALAVALQPYSNTHFLVFTFRGNVSHDNRGLGVERPAELSQEDDEYDAYRKRMMLAYRFRPNPLVSLASFTISSVSFFFLSFSPRFTQKSTCGWPNWS